MGQSDGEDEAVWSAPRRRVNVLQAASAFVSTNTPPKAEENVETSKSPSAVANLLRSNRQPPATKPKRSLLGHVVATKKAAKDVARSSKEAVRVARAQESGNGHGADDGANDGPGGGGGGGGESSGGAPTDPGDAAAKKQTVAPKLDAAFKSATSGGGMLGLLKARGDSMAVAGTPNHQAGSGNGAAPKGAEFLVREKTTASQLAALLFRKAKGNAAQARADSGKGGGDDGGAKAGDGDGGGSSGEGGRGKGDRGVARARRKVGRARARDPTARVKCVKVLQMEPERRSEEDLDLLVDFLYDNEFFLRFERERRQRLATVLRYESFGFDRSVFNAGDAGDKFYIILSGTVAVWLPRPDEGDKNLTKELSLQEKAMRKLQPGDPVASKGGSAAGGETGGGGGGGGGGEGDTGGGGGGGSSGEGNRGGGEGDGDDEEEEEEEVQMFDCVAELAQGASFGELALLTDKPRAATISTLTTCEFMTISREDYAATIKVMQEEEIESKIRALRALPAFRNASRGDVQRISSFFTEYTFARGEPVLQQGEPVTDDTPVLILTKGQVTVQSVVATSDRSILTMAHGETVINMKRGRGGGAAASRKAYEVAMIGPGAHFGAYAVREHCPQPFTVLASSACTFLGMSKINFVRRLSNAESHAFFRDAQMQHRVWSERVEQLQMTRAAAEAALRKSAADSSQPTAPKGAGSARAAAKKGRPSSSVRGGERTAGAENDDSGPESASPSSSAQAERQRRRREHGVVNSIVRSTDELLAGLRAVTGDHVGLVMHMSSRAGPSPFAPRADPLGLLQEAKAAEGDGAGADGVDGVNGGCVNSGHGNDDDGKGAASNGAGSAKSTSSTKLPPVAGARAASGGGGGGTRRGEKKKFSRAGPQNKQQQQQQQSGSRWDTAPRGYRSGTFPVPASTLSPGPFNAIALSSANAVNALVGPDLTPEEAVEALAPIASLEARAEHFGEYPERTSGVYGVARRGQRWVDRAANGPGAVAAAAAADRLPPPRTAAERKKMARPTYSWDATLKLADDPGDGGAGACDGSGRGDDTAPADPRQAREAAAEVRSFMKTTSLRGALPARPTPASRHQAKARLQHRNTRSLATGRVLVNMAGVLRRDVTL